MSRANFTTIRLALLAGCLSLAPGCGRTSSQAGGTISQPAEAYEIPDALKSPPNLSPVPLGSKAVAVYPPPGAVAGTLLLKMASEPGAKVYFGFRAITDTTPLEDLTEFTQSLLLLPPVSLWVVAVKDGARGPVRELTYDLDQAAFPPLTLAATRRLFLPLAPPTPLPRATEQTLFAAAGTAALLTTTPELDGAAKEWSLQGRLSGLDGLYDVPPGYASADLSWAQVGETADALYLALATRAKPEPGIAYGADLGPSQVGLASFGKGADYRWRIEATTDGDKTTLRLVERATSQEVKLSTASSAFCGAICEFKVAKADLPGFEGLKEIALRPLTQLVDDGVTVNERMEPIFLRSAFAARRAPASVDAQRTFELAFFYDPEKEAALAPLASEYLSYGQALLPELEALNGIRFLNSGSLPLFFVAKEENGYSGLNTTDRGLLTTVGPGTSALAKTQLLAHELAHFQNARLSQLKSRWLQEGMSEWTAERVLYRRFPPRAVYRFMRGLRFDRYFDQLGGKPDGFPLGKWGGEAATLGYEKSMMMMALLDHLVGTEPLRKAFQVALNQPMDDLAFRRFLEQETGQDLAGVFGYYVDDGAAVAELDPYRLFKDEDGDDLLTLDELRLGTDPKKADSDADGFPDGEEAFANAAPPVSAIDPEGSKTAPTPELIVPDHSDLSAPLRLGGAKGTTFTYSLNPFAASAVQPFTGPVILRPPFVVAADGKKDGTAAGVRQLTRDLYVAGAKVAITYAADHILPPTPVTTLSLATGLTYSGGAGTTASPLADHAADLPRFLAGYDHTGVALAAASTTYDVSLTTAGKPEPYGDWGDIVLTFDAVTYGDNGPAVTRHGALTLSGGTAYWHTFSGNVESSAPLEAGLDAAWGDTDLKLRLDKALLTSWAAAAGDRVMCVVSNLVLVGEGRFREKAGCVTHQTTSYTPRSAVGPDRFGTGKHTVELFYNNAEFSEAKAKRYLELMHAAVTTFELVAGRPFVDRSHWPLHLTVKPATATFGTGGSANARTGAWLNVDKALEAYPYALDYLVVEQLARLHVADLLERNSERPFWIQEAYIQWLVGSAMYRIYPTKGVHKFHEDRIDQGLGADDIALRDWNIVTLDSNGSVKSLAFLLVLDAALGADVMAKAFTHFMNQIPDAAGFETMLKAIAPAQSAAIDDLFADFVETTGGMGDRFQDADADGLFKFEEQKLGTLDAVADDYLD